MDITIDLPFPSVVTPHAHTVEEANRACAHWMTSVAGLSPAATATRIDWSLARVAADFCAESTQADTTLMHIFLIWTVLVDDYFDGPSGKDPERAQRAVSQLTSTITVPPTAAPPSAAPLTRATADLWLRLFTDASSTWTKHTAERLRRWIGVFVIEARMRQQEVVPDLETYVAIRRISIAMDIFADVTERVCSIELPGYLRTSHVVHGMHECMSDIVGFTNDVRTVEIEVGRGDRHNLVLVVAARNNCSHQEAVDKISVLVMQACRRFNALAAELPKLARSDTDRQIARRYAAIVRDQAQTHESWCRRTSRYERP